MNVVPATCEHLESWYGFVPDVRAVAFLDGEAVAGVAGVYRHEGADWLFGDIDAVRGKALVRGIRAVLALSPGPLHAFADEGVPEAAGMLEHMGFRCLGGNEFVRSAP